MVQFEQKPTQFRPSDTQTELFQTSPTARKKHTLFVACFSGSNQFCPGGGGGGYSLCVYFMTEAHEGSTESGSGEAWNRICDP